MSLFKHYAQGLLMGGADIIPGVSGGTMALIVGIYERLIDAISTLFSSVLALLRADLPEARRHVSNVDWRLLLPLGLGIGSALVVGARIIPVVMEAYPAQSLGLFFGLVAASIFIPWQRISVRDARVFGMAALAAAAAFLLTGLPALTTTDPALLVVFGCAAVAICAMILPGVSGAFLLKALGLYEATLLALNERDVVYVLVFMAGAALGLGLFSKVLSWLLDHYHDLTMAALVGLMAGALRALWPWQTAHRALYLPSGDDPILSVVALMVIGFALVFTLTWWSDRLEADAREERRRAGPQP